jgi:hypothetical protein
MPWAAPANVTSRRASRARTAVRSLRPPVANTLPPCDKGGWPTPAHDSYLVDSASSHMLVSKIKPCMSKYKQLYRETANGSLNQL